MRIAVALPFNIKVAVEVGLSAKVSDGCHCLRYQLFISGLTAVRKLTEQIERERERGAEEGESGEMGSVGVEPGAVSYTLRYGGLQVSLV